MQIFALQRRDALVPKGRPLNLSPEERKEYYRAYAREYANTRSGGKGSLMTCSCGMPKPHTRPSGLVVCLHPFCGGVIAVKGK